MTLTFFRFDTFVLHVFFTSIFLLRFCDLTGLGGIMGAIFCNFTPLLHCTTGVLQPLAFVFCSHPVCFVERLMLQLCVICVLHTNEPVVLADMSFVLHVLFLSFSVPRPRDVCTVTTFVCFSFCVCNTQLTSTAYFFLGFNVFFSVCLPFL